MERLRQIASSIWNLFSIAGTLQFILSLGGASLVTTAATKLSAVAGWLEGPYLVLGGFGVFCVTLAVMLAYLPRVWTPRSPLAEYFGSAAVMVGMSEEIDRRLFRRIPQVKTECRNVVDRLHRFVAEQRRAIPQPPVPPYHGEVPDEEQEQYRVASRAAEQKTISLYEARWQRRVNSLFEDARAMFFGPVPTARTPVRSLDEIERIAGLLDAVAHHLPSNYTDEFHAARVESLRALKGDGLSLAYDIRQFAIQRQQEASALSAQLSQEPGHDPGSEVRWKRERDFDRETEVQFLSQFGGSLKHIWERLRRFGLGDESLDRLFSWMGHMHMSSHDIPAIAIVVDALCRRIPYD